MVPLPIPLHGFQGSDIHAGTGFLVENGSMLWLETCAHIITGLRETPALAHSQEGAQIVGTLYTRGPSSIRRQIQSLVRRSAHRRFKTQTEHLTA